jgi:hypothetical protein
MMLTQHRLLMGMASFARVGMSTVLPHPKQLLVELQG